MLVHCLYVTAKEIGADRFAEGRFILGAVGFGAARPDGLDASCPFVRIEMPALDSEPLYEVWTSAAPVAWRDRGGLWSGVSGKTMFAILQPGASLHAEPGADIEAWARYAYGRMFAAADEAGCPHVLRTFNYLPRIADIEHGTERYRRFNTGREAAFLDRGQAMDAAPAACALGISGDMPVVYFMASSEPGQAVENPRQVSAYRYPARYGRSSPSFSRAMMSRQEEAAVVFVSGTASIVGHESLHAGDAGAQTDETLRNLSALFDVFSNFGIPDRSGNQAGLDDALVLKVYVRHVDDLPCIRARLAGLPLSVRVVYLRADICRPELLVEIEAFFGRTVPRLLYHR